MSSKKTNSDKQNTPFLSRVVLENFRGYKNYTEVNFGKRITLFFGKGSVGKTTVMDAINCIHETNRSQVEMEGLSERHTLSKQDKKSTGKFKIGFYCKDNEYERGVVKTFKIEKDDSKLESLTLFSPTDDEKNQKFVEFDASKTYSENFRKVMSNAGLNHNYLFSVNFIENKLAFQELYEETFKNKDALIAKLDEVKKFTEYMVKNFEEEFREEKKTNPDKKKIEQLKLERDKLFTQYKSDDFEYIFSPWRFRFQSTKIIENHKNFLSKKRSYDEFLKYIGDDARNTKRYIFKNFKIYTRREIDDIIDRERLDQKSRETLTSYDSLTEFLTYTLTGLLCSGKEIFPTKNYFMWSPKKPGKVLTGDEMLITCSRLFIDVVNKITNIRQINPNELLPSFNNKNSSIHELIESNLSKINKWLRIFEYDFSISVDRAGVGDTTEINHKKFGQKLPASQGGSGVDYLLTFLPSCVASKNKIILLEEPEKSLHARMQVNLADLFEESSEQNQLIIETHSENLLLGILKHVREGKIDVNDIKINYVYMDDDGVSKIDPLTVNKKGGFDTKWRHGFFTEKLDLL